MTRGYVPRDEPEPIVDRVNGKQLAKYLGVTEAAITAAVKAGRIRRGPDHLFDAEQAKEDFERTRQRLPGPGRGVRVQSPAADGDESCPVCGALKDIQYWTTRKTREEALSKRLLRFELQGKLVRRDAAEDVQAELASMMRKLTEGIGADLQEDLAAETDPRRCADMVNDAIRTALERAADQIEDDSIEEEENEEAAEDDGEE